MTRIFTLIDQANFAELSGDHNPMHVDPVAARRLLFGRPVVHGIHVLLWAVDSLLTETDLDRKLSIVSLNAAFRRPVLIDDEISLRIKMTGPGKWKLEVIVAASVAQTITLQLTEAVGSEAAVSPNSPQRLEPREVAESELATAGGQLRLHLDTAAAKQLLPQAERLLRADQFAFLLASSRLVGMELPGLHSLYTGLRLQSIDPLQPALSFKTEEYEDRFSMLTVHVEGAGLAGKITALVRPKPVKQKTFASLRDGVPPNAFAGERALIIGGSRGLGEVLVKLLLIGGADVQFTYHQGAADAQNLLTEAADAGYSPAAFAFNVLSESAKIDPDLGAWRPTSVYYFATPYIGSSPAGQFSTATFARFSEFYLAGFLRLVKSLITTSPDLKRVIYPSSSMVADLPPEFLEYSLSKAAGENLCSHLARQHPNIHFHAPRLQRLATDQTSGLMQSAADDPAEYLLQLLLKLP